MQNLALTVKIKKVLISIRLYGFSRTYVKLFGRNRNWKAPKFTWTFKRNKKIVGIIGCGQFSFSTIGYFLKKQKGDIIAACYDTNINQSHSFAFYYKCEPCGSVDDLLAYEGIEIIYIASNHASHTEYSIKCIERGLTVHVEKPLSTSFYQLQRLQNALHANPKSRIFLGYNRPFSPAITTLSKFLSKCSGALTLSCFIIGHKIARDHWYRMPNEGTRVCGNLGHWLDLSIHLLWNKPHRPTNLKIVLNCSNKEEPDDNLTVCLSSDNGDLIAITMTSRSEPFEGINETINCQCDNVISKIDDFRRQKLWIEHIQHKYRYFRKDVGHKLSILQPFQEGRSRNWEEVEISTRLMLTIAKMINDKEYQSGFPITESNFPEAVPSKKQSTTET